MATTNPAPPSSLLLENALLPLLYALSLNIDHRKPNFSGSLEAPLTTNDLCPATDSAFSLTLHAHKIIITKAVLKTDESDLPLTVKYARDVQTVALTSTTDLSQLIDKNPRVHLTFMGTVTSIKTFRDETYGIYKTNYSDSHEGKSDNYVIATHAQPFGCRSMFPVIDESVHKVPIQLTLVAKSSFKVASNGKLVKSTIVDLTENSVFEFQATPPIAPSVFGFVVGDFECLESQDSSVPIRVLATKGDGKSATYALKVASDLLPRFEELFGVSYPLEKFDMVALPFLSDWVMENWGMVTVIRDSLLLDESTAPEAAKLQLRQLIAHQLTHQWFGNMITLDEFKWMWLNEAFATWAGNYVLSLAKLDLVDSQRYKLDKLFLIENTKDTNDRGSHQLESLHEHMSSLRIDLKAKTDSIFEKDAYDKGMILLNMIGSLFQIEAAASDLGPFFNAMKKVFTAYQFKTFKPFEMWGILNQEISVDLLTFVNSWIQYSGYPLLTVEVENSKLKIVQNRYLPQAKDEASKEENQPYHVPLALKLLTDEGKVKYVNLMLTDRSIELDIPATQLISLNADRQFNYAEVYDSTLQQSILDHISANRMSSLELIGLINDYGRILGQADPSYKPQLFGSHELVMIIAICNVVAGDQWIVDYDVLKLLLGYVEYLNEIFAHYSKYDEFKHWLDNFSRNLFNKIGGWEEVLKLEEASYDHIEFEVRGLILQLGIATKESQEVCKKLYKNFVNGGVAKRFIPKELLASVFNVTLAHANMNEYKQILNLVKNANVSYLSHTNATATELQTTAVASLAFSTKDELLSKTLHFVNNNIDSKMIELALIGFKFQHSPRVKEILWAWYKVNYDQWIKRSLRKGSDWSKQIGIAVGNITILVLEVMHYKRDAALEFVEAKLRSLPPHGLRERLEKYDKDNVDRITVASHYSAMVKAFNM